MKKVILTAVMVLAASSAFAAAGAITDTKHDLSKNSTGATHKDGTETQICKFCHVPHNAGIAKLLWSRSTGSATAMYANTDSINATLATSTGFNAAGTTSLLCLSCHDGTASVSSAGNITSSANLTQDISNTHPIGFVYDAALVTADGGGLVAVASLPATIPLFTGKVECASCHAVHDNTNAPFLRVSNTTSGLCKSCHIK